MYEAAQAEDLWDAATHLGVGAAGSCLISLSLLLSYCFIVPAKQMT